MARSWKQLKRSATANGVRTISPDGRLASPTTATAADFAQCVFAAAAAAAPSACNHINFILTCFMCDAFTNANVEYKL